jgi:hypothetical protein
LDNYLQPLLGSLPTCAEVRQSIAAFILY